MRIKRFNESLKDELEYELSFILDFGFKLNVWDNPALYEVQLEKLRNSNITLNDIKEDLLSFIDYRKSDIILYEGVSTIRILFDNNEWLDMTYDELNSDKEVYSKGKGFINLGIYRNKRLNGLYLMIKKD